MADTLVAAAEPNSFTDSKLRVYTEEDCSAFECNICLELAKEPVVTFCGHLYCWPCLYRWMQVNRQCQRCPVCNSGIDVETVVPIYGRGTEGTDQSTDATDDDSAPARPTGRRAIPVARTPLEINQDNVNSVNANQSVVRMLFGFIQGSNMALPDMPAAEQQQQAFLSRLLLMLGSFVIMCLLLF